MINAQDVIDWQDKIKAAGQDFKDKSEKVKFMEKLLAEEYDEFVDAVRKNDEVEKLDACVDMMFVIIGYMYAKGWDIEGAWKELTRSNNSKFYPNDRLTIDDNGKIVKTEYFIHPKFKPYLKGE